ncbi:MAG: hypothetical protein GWO08_19520, partial [Gammaproteobacteria bacterium]|nr:hypothetical protein [Gammaproteobacteria bacterium]NIW50373.1 hypothetical protein [Gammaproteobacteria bacterium]NIX59753.1 hypothetical protein [candidate division Zixibacteria bacterium]
FEFEKYRGGSITGFENPVVNASEADKGKLTFAHAYPYGAEGEVNILNVHLKVVGKVGSNISLSLNFEAMA